MVHTTTSAGEIFYIAPLNVCVLITEKPISKTKIEFTMKFSILISFLSLQ